MRAELVRLHGRDNPPYRQTINLAELLSEDDGYVQLSLEEDQWKDFRDEKGFFSPYLLSHHFKKLVME